MHAFKKILVPVDLSRSCQPAISLASTLARCTGAELVFCHVALPPLPETALHAQQEMDDVISRDHEDFLKVRPDDPSVKHEHVFLRGNPGPEILAAAKNQDCDLIVLATHGRTGFVRWLLGSVAEYIIRNAACPVVTIKMDPAWQTEPGPDPARQESEEEPPRSAPLSFSRSPFVTSAMQHVVAIEHEDRMDAVAVMLKAANSTSAPVVDNRGKCVGILTTTDIQRYAELQRRLEEHDESVLEEVFETDDFGIRRASSETFHRVKRHMTTPVVTIPVSATCRDAMDLLDQHPSIHHLVVVDESGRPLGVVEPQQLEEHADWNATADRLATDH